MPKSNRIFLYYFLIISVLALYTMHLFKQKRLSELLYDDLMDTGFGLKRVLQNDDERLVFQIEKQCKDYPSLFNNTIMQKGEILNGQIENLEKTFTKGKVETKFYKYWDGAFGWKDIKSSPPHPDSFLIHSKKLADSLFAFAKRDDKTLAQVQIILPENHTRNFKEVFTGNRPEQKAAFAVASSIYHLAASQKILMLLDKMIYAEDYKFDGFLPIVHFQNSCPWAGETIFGEVEIGQFSSVNRRLMFQVNGKAFPIENGLGKFKQVFDSPGTKDLHIRFSDRNPLTGQVYRFESKTSIEICN